MRACKPFYSSHPQTPRLRASTPPGAPSRTRAHAHHHPAARKQVTCKLEAFARCSLPPASSDQQQPTVTMPIVQLAPPLTHNLSQNHSHLLRCLHRYAQAGELHPLRSALLGGRTTTARALAARPGGRGGIRIGAALLGCGCARAALLGAAACLALVLGAAASLGAGGVLAATGLRGGGALAAAGGHGTTCRGSRVPYRKSGVSVRLRVQLRACLWTRKHHVPHLA